MNNIYKYEIFTDPYDPEVKDKYINFLSILDDYKESNKIIKKTIQALNNGIVYHYIEINVDDDILQNIISEISYQALIYSIENTNIEMAYDIDKISQLVKEYLNKKFYLDIYYMENVNIDNNIIFSAYDKDMFAIHLNPRVFNRISSIEYKDIVKKSVLKENQAKASTDPLLPYISAHIDNEIDIVDDIFIIDKEVEDVLKKYKKEGYITIPTKGYHMSKYNIDIAAEYLHEYEAEIERIDPYLIAKCNKIEANPFITRNMQLESDIPSINLRASPKWIVKTRDYERDDTRILLELYYCTIIAYIKLMTMYPILNNQLSNIKLINSHTINVNFANTDQIHKFKYIWHKKLKYIMVYNPIEYIPFIDINQAVAYKQKIKNIDSVIIDTEQIGISGDIMYYLVLEKPKGAELPNHDEDYQPEIINLFIDEHQDIDHNVNQVINNDININNDNVSLIDLLSYHLYENKLYSESSFREVLNGIYTINNKVYPYSYAIKNKKLMLYGYFPSTSGFTSGLMEKIPGIISIDMSNIGILIMNKHKLDDDHILYNFTIVVNSSDYLIANNNAEINNNHNKLNIINRRNEIRLVNKYRPDLAKISTNYLPEEDPGHIIQLFSIMLPFEAYTDNNIYDFINKIWSKGYLLSDWSKYIYFKHKKLSHKKLVIPEIISMSESIDDSLKFIKIFRDLL